MITSWSLLIRRGLGTFFIDIIARFFKEKLSSIRKYFINNFLVGYRHYYSGVLPSLYSKFENRELVPVQAAPVFF
jgi:hypothetical protein